MIKSILPAAALVIGVLLLIVSALWPAMFPPTNSWTTEKSEQLSELGSETNRLKFQLVEARNNVSMHSGRNPAEIKAEYDRVREDYDRLHAEFESARESPQNIAKALQWAGVGLASVGAVLAMMFRSSE